MEIFSRLRNGLNKTRDNISSIVGDEKKISEEFFEALEDALISSDMGADISCGFIERLRENLKDDKADTVSEAYSELKRILINDLRVRREPDEFPPKPWVIIVAGVNGVGKTTTIAKIARELRQNGKKVLLAAADTFRAGAIEQLRIWAGRTGSEFISQPEGSDPASVAFDAIESAKTKDVDTVLIDTAGRLHNKENLMREIEKIKRVVKRSLPHAPNEILLVIDATTGQNALKQVEMFNRALGITGLIVTKLDGTAKGGIAVALAKKFGIPIKKIGVGEKAEDFQDFNPESYVEAILGDLEDY